MLEKSQIYNIHHQNGSYHRWRTTFALLLTAVSLGLISRFLYRVSPPSNARTILSQCEFLRVKPGPPPNFHERKVSDRFAEGTRPLLIQNATIWTGGREGTEVVFGDLLMDGGIIKAVGNLPVGLIKGYAPQALDTINVNGAWVTPGLFDLHSHVGLLSLPQLTGASDGNSPHGPIIPWVRSIDAFNTRDAAFALTVAGGVTGGLVLPGSGNGIGGQAFVVKYRRTSERSPSSMLIEPPLQLNGSAEWDPSKSLPWRHMKHATGENQIKYGTRMDSTWAFRDAYNKARQIKEAQDSFCAKAELGLWNDPEIKGKEFPFDLQWESLVDVLRGRVKVNCHTYETEDIDFLSRLTNEFKFSLAAIHHAHEAYLVPEVLKRMWGGPPAVASFGINARYKRESYRGSEFAHRILADNGISVVLKSDHPVVDSRYLLFEVQQAHFYGLPTNLALRSVTTTSAIAAGLSHRLGHISKGYDADIVIWDSHPLALGATPKQVFIDGIPQIEQPHSLAIKPGAFQRPPRTPNWDHEINETLKWDGLPPLKPSKRVQDVVFLNVRNVWKRNGLDIVDVLRDTQLSNGVNENSTVLVSNGRIACMGTKSSCSHSISHHEIINLKGGAISLGLTTYGSPLGLAEIKSEPSTSDGYHFNPLDSVVPPILNDVGAGIEAIDGLQFEGLDTLMAYRSGVTTAISAWVGGNFPGTSVMFRTGASHALEEGAVIKNTAALHVSIGSGYVRNGKEPGVSTQIAALRSLLSGNGEDNTGELFRRVVEGKLPLIISVDKADIMASLIRLKREIECNSNTSIKLAFSGATEAHLLADELAEAGVSVIIRPLHSFPNRWDAKRILPGPPLSRDTPITALLSKNVTVAIGIKETWQARNAMLEVGWAALDSGFNIKKEDALALSSTSLLKIFDIEAEDDELEDLVAYQGGDMFSFESKVVGIISPRGGYVDLI